MKILVIILNLTWGAIMNVIGGLAALALLITGHKPTIYGHCLLFEVGNGWGGVDLGLVIITCRDISPLTRSHELGHSLQNAVFGPLFPFLVAIPSAVRYQYFAWAERHEKTPKRDYFDIWFEKHATFWGARFILKNYTRKGH